MVSPQRRRPSTITNSSNRLSRSHTPTIRTKVIHIPHCTRTSMRAFTHKCQSTRNTPLSTRKSRIYLRTTIRVCEAPTMARSIATLLVLWCLDGWTGFRFGLWLCAVLFPGTLFVFFLLHVRPDLASVSSSCMYVCVWCGFLVVPGGHAGLEGIDWGMVLCMVCFCKSSRVCSCRKILSDSQKDPPSLILNLLRHHLQSDLRHFSHDKVYSTLKLTL